jgi:hypothetical protein
MIKQIQVSHRPTINGPTMFKVDYEVGGVSGDMTIPAQDAIESNQIACARLNIPFRGY